MQGKFDVICFGGEDWWYHNRGHFDMQLMRRFARTGTTVYINSIVMTKPNVTHGRKFIQKLARKAKSILTGLKKSDAGFWVYSPFSLPVHHIRWLRPVNKIILRGQMWLVSHKLGLRNPIVWVACPAACDVALKMKKSKLVYQRTDRFEDTPNVDVEIIKKYDRRLKDEADLTIFVNKVLYEEESAQCKKALYLDHGVDYEMFASAEENQRIPSDINGISRPIVGYFGGIADHKFDIGLLQKVVDLLPEKSFVFVGQASQECNGLRTRKNVWMLGQKPYEQIPHYGKCFDAAILPWKLNRWTGVANPIKLKEYLALGKPIISTPVFTQIEEYLDVISVAETPEDFAVCIVKALKENSPKHAAVRRKKVEKDTWDSKARLVMEQLFGSTGPSAMDTDQ